MNEGMTSAEVVRSLAAAYARLRRGEVTDREAYADTVVLRDRLKKIIDAAAPGRWTKADKIVVIDQEDKLFHPGEKRYVVGRAGVPEDRTDVDTWEEVEAILGTTGLPDRAAVEALEADIVRRRLRGEVSEAVARRELFIVKALKEGIDAAGGSMPEVIVFKITHTLTDPAKPKGPPVKLTMTA